MAACSMIIKIWTGTTAFHRGLIPSQEAAPTQRLVRPMFHTQGGHLSRLSQQRAASAGVLLKCSCFQHQHLQKRCLECGVQPCKSMSDRHLQACRWIHTLGKFGSDQSEGGKDIGLLGCFTAGSEGPPAASTPLSPGLLQRMQVM